MKMNRNKIALDMLLCNSVTDVCQLNSISESTYYRLKKDKKFTLILEEAKNKLFKDSMSEIQALSSVAVRTLKEVALDKTASASSRVSASSRILDIALTAYDIDIILERIELLEQSR